MNDTTQGATLDAIAAAIEGARVAGEDGVTGASGARRGGVRVHGASQDSRMIEPGWLFCVRRGARSDGRAYVGDALARGASAVLAEDASVAEGLGVPVLLVPDARKAIGAAAMIAFGHPDRALRVIGVTGTNGKTTTTHLVTSMLDGTGGRAAVLGTLGASLGELEIPSTHTTPEGDAVARIAAEVARRGATHLVMEVSSHALTLERATSVHFAVAAFTNLTQDHLDFHGSMEAYGAAKARLFTDLAPERSVVCVDSAFGRELAGRVTGERLTVAAAGGEADLRVVAKTLDAQGLHAVVAAPGGLLSLRSPLVGAHNLENLLVALGIGVASGLDPQRAADALASAPPVPGRLERCSGAGDDVLVVVDYAHTPDALERVLAALRPLTPGALACVFGCGGDRDPDKRPRMGEAVALGADRAIVTNDNPRTEAPEAIARAIVPGLERHGREYLMILDRAEAIAHAILTASPGDTVLIAGKGHEPYQITGETMRPFDDRKEARRALQARQEQTR